MINVLVLNELKEIATSSHDTGLGEVDGVEICQELSKLTGRKWKPRSKYSDEDRYTIAKYAKKKWCITSSKVFQEQIPNNK